MSFAAHGVELSNADLELCGDFLGLNPAPRQPPTFLHLRSFRQLPPPDVATKSSSVSCFCPLFASIKSDPASRAYYDKKRAEGKRHHNQAVIALARRRADVLFAMLRTAASTKTRPAQHQRKISLPPLDENCKAESG